MCKKTQFNANKWNDFVVEFEDSEEDSLIASYEEDKFISRPKYTSVDKQK